MSSEKILSIGFYLGLGALAYHIYLKKKGVLNTHKQVEAKLDDARITLHNYLDQLSEGQAKEAEIEDRVYTIIPK